MARDRVCSDSPYSPGSIHPETFLLRPTASGPFQNPFLVHLSPELTVAPACFFRSCKPRARAACHCRWLFAVAQCRGGCSRRLLLRLHLRGHIHLLRSPIPSNHCASSNGGIKFLTGRIAVSSKTPSGSPVMRSLRITPPVGSGVSEWTSSAFQCACICRCKMARGMDNANWMGL